MIYTEKNENISIYLKEISKNSTMTREDEVRLFSRISNGDQSARDEIFSKMSRYAVSVAKEYANDPEMLEDLIQEANIGILDAIMKYDVTQGYRFMSYAVWWMRAYINKFLDDNGTVHKSGNNLDAKIRKIKEDFYNEYYTSISTDELVDRLMEMGEENVNRESLIDIRMTSIDSPVNEDGDDTFEDCATYNDKSCSDNEAEKMMDDESLADDIRKMMRVLDDRERTFVMKMYGIGYDFEKDTDTIAKEYNATVTNPDKDLSSERVRQIIKGALKKMKNIGL